MRKLLFIAAISIVFQGCINQKVTQSDVFNPVKEFELNTGFKFKRDFIQNTDTTQLEYWYITEYNPQFNLIYLSGNGSNVRSAIPFFNELGNQLNLNIFTFNYSGYGLSEGKPTIDGIVRDGKVALDHFKNNIGDQDLPTVLLGYSLGGYVALSIIDTDFIDQGVLMSTFSSLEELQDYLLKEALPGVIRPFLKLDIDTSIYKLNNVKLVQKNNKPLLFIHGGSDDFIPSSMSYGLYNLSPAENKQIKIIENADHRAILKDQDINPKVVAEIKRFLNI